MLPFQCFQPYLKPYEVGISPGKFFNPNELFLFCFVKFKAIIGEIQLSAQFKKNNGALSIFSIEKKKIFFRKKIKIVFGELLIFFLFCIVEKSLNFVFPA
jgi:hypothetical protein